MTIINEIHLLIQLIKMPTSFNKVQIVFTLARSVYFIVEEVFKQTTSNTIVNAPHIGMFNVTMTTGING